MGTRGVPVHWPVAPTVMATVLRAVSTLPGPSAKANRTNVGLADVAVVLGKAHHQYGAVGSTLYAGVALTPAQGSADVCTLTYTRVPAAGRAARFVWTSAASLVSAGTRHAAAALAVPRCTVRLLLVLST